MSSGEQGRRQNKQLVSITPETQLNVVVLGGGVHSKLSRDPTILASHAAKVAEPLKAPSPPLHEEVIRGEEPLHALYDNSEVNFLGHTIADKYYLKQELGRGGMGVVYLAQIIDPLDPRYEQSVALKMVLKEEWRKRFLQEITLTMDLKHINIVRGLDRGLYIIDHRVYPFLVMEYVPGESLESILIREKQINPAKIVKLLIQVCDAIYHAHLKGVIHRDLKPSNILVTRNDEVKIIDLGVAKLLGIDAHSIVRLTQTGQIFGTVEYISPEQAKGETCNFRTDIYALGAILYELLCGLPVFAEDQNPVSILMKQVNENPVSPLARMDGIDGSYPTIVKDLASLALDALKKHPEHRPANMAIFKTRLIAAGTGVEQDASHVLSVAPQARQDPAKEEPIIFEPVRPSEVMQPVAAQTEALSYLSSKWRKFRNALVLTTATAIIGTALGSLAAVYMDKIRNQKDNKMSDNAIVTNNPTVDGSYKLTVNVTTPGAKVYILETAPDGRVWHRDCGNLPVRRVLNGPQIVIIKAPNHLPKEFRVDAQHPLLEDIALQPNR